MLRRPSAWHPLLALLALSVGSACAGESRDQVVSGSAAAPGVTPAPSPLGPAPEPSGTASGTSVDMVSTAGHGAGGSADAFAGHGGVGVGSGGAGGVTASAGGRLGAGGATPVAGAAAGGRSAAGYGGQLAAGVAGASVAVAGGGGASGAGTLGASGMAGAGGAATLPAATFTDVYNQVFLVNCLNSGCHNNSKTEPYFGSKQRTYDFFVQPNVIFPGENPDYSAIYVYMAWEIMPPDPKPKVPQDQLDLVAGWILAGALNN